MSVRKKNYEPSSLTDLQRSIDRHLRYLDKEDSILNDKKYEGSRQAIEAKHKELRRQGKEEGKMQLNHLLRGKRIASGQLENWRVTAR